MDLAQMGAISISVYDEDIVSDLNLPSQRYKLSQVGQPKVVALAENVTEYSNTRVFSYPRHFTQDDELSGLVIAGVDTMAARKMIWQKTKMNLHVPLYIEGRMSPDLLIVHALRPTDIDQVRWYESTLYDDEEVVERRCTDRSTVYTSRAIAAFITNNVKKFAMGQPVPKKIQYDFVTMYQVVEN